MERRENRGRTKFESITAGDPVPRLCEYLRAFEKSVKKIRGAKGNQ